MGESVETSTIAVVIAPKAQPMKKELADLRQRQKNGETMVPAAAPASSIPSKVAALPRLLYRATPENLACNSETPSSTATGKKRKREGHVLPKICSICMSDLEEETTVITLPRCVHIFCETCITKWLSTCSKTCPLCRADCSPPEQEPVKASTPKR